MFHYVSFRLIKFLIYAFKSGVQTNRIYGCVDDSVQLKCSHGEFILVREVHLGKTRSPIDSCEIVVIEGKPDCIYEVIIDELYVFFCYVEMLLINENSSDNFKLFQD